MLSLTITPKDAVDRLAACGIRMGCTKLCAALTQNKVPFGFALEMEAGKHEYVIFAKDLDDFIRAHGGEPA